MVQLILVIRNVVSCAERDPSFFAQGDMAPQPQESFNGTLKDLVVATG